MDNNSKSRCFYGKSSEHKHSKKDDIQSSLKLKSFMLKLPLALSEETCQSWFDMYVFGLELMLGDKKIKWRCISGTSSEDKQSIKRDKHSIMIFKSYTLRL